MDYELNHLDYTGLKTAEEAFNVLKDHGCEQAVIKKLSKNNNDKNQVYIHKSISVFNSMFALEFNERDESASVTKRASKPGKRIPEALFKNFSWVSKDLSLHKVKGCKAILYAQYPETRLSAFQTENNEMPRSMSVEYTKKEDLPNRFLLIGATKEGSAVAMMILAPSEQFLEDFVELQNAVSSGVIKFIDLGKSDNRTEQLKQLLTEKVSRKSLLGCRLDRDGNTIPFTGTQVCGYTLEHALDIRPNADKDGDIFGIELKAISQKKVTLFTPEPDGGLYKESFPKFMKTYGYLKGTDEYRFTGIHRANIKNEKSNLTLKILYLEKGKSKDTFVLMEYSPDRSIDVQARELRVSLVDENGFEAATWSFERMLNSWGVKHNETVYYPVKKVLNENKQELEDGYKYRVEFDSKALWCQKTQISMLFNAIHDGTVILDPAPKYVEGNPKLNKRRSQWRINDIYRDSNKLYESINLIEL